MEIVRVDFKQPFLMELLSQRTIIIQERILDILLDVIVIVVVLICVGVGVDIDIDIVGVASIDLASVTARIAVTIMTNNVIVDVNHVTDVVLVQHLVDVRRVVTIERVGRIDHHHGTTRSRTTHDGVVHVRT